MRIACGIEYDGSRFVGWQRQRNRDRTIQGQVEHALSQVADHPVRIHCAGRTDTGVHAVEQVIHFDTPVERLEKAWVMGGNTALPEDISIHWARPVDESFHARYSATRRHYRYLFLEGWNRPALLNNRVAWTHMQLDDVAMHTAAAHLIGEHDFTTFRSVHCQAKHPIRTIHDLRVGRRHNLVVIDIRANAFLHNMVRIIAGCLMVVGQKEQHPDWIAELLAMHDRRVAGMTAPATGLYFMGAHYHGRFGLPGSAEPVWPCAAASGL